MVENSEDSRLEAREQVMSLRVLSFSEVSQFLTGFGQDEWRPVSCVVVHPYIYSLT